MAFAGRQGERVFGQDDLPAVVAGLGVEAHVERLGADVGHAECCLNPLSVRPIGGNRDRVGDVATERGNLERQRQHPCR
jgi:hypothetical protein